MGLDGVDEGDDDFSQNEGFEQDNKIGQDVSRDIQDVAHHVQVIPASVHVELVSPGFARWPR